MPQFFTMSCILEIPQESWPNNVCYFALWDLGACLFLRDRVYKTKHPQSLDQPRNKDYVDMSTHGITPNIFINQYT